MFDIDKIVGWYDKPRMDLTVPEDQIPTMSLFLGVYGWVQAFSNASVEADEEMTYAIINWAMHEPEGKHIIINNKALQRVHVMM